MYNSGIKASVLKKIKDIDGETYSYKDVGESIGNGNASRAVEWQISQIKNEEKNIGKDNKGTEII